MVTNEVDVTDEVIASGGFADIKSATFGGRAVAVRSLRVASRDETEIVWNVSLIHHVFGNIFHRWGSSDSAVKLSFGIR